MLTPATPIDPNSITVVNFLQKLIFVLTLGATIWGTRATLLLQQQNNLYNESPSKGAGVLRIDIVQ